MYPYVIFEHRFNHFHALPDPQLEARPFGRRDRVRRLDPVEGTDGITRFGVGLQHGVGQHMPGASGGLEDRMEA